MVYCRKCGGAPEMIRVGDQKEYFLVRCSKCYNASNKYDEASCTESHALKVWYQNNGKSKHEIGFDDHDISGLLEDY